MPDLEGSHPWPAPARAAGQPLAEPPAPRHLGVPRPLRPPIPCHPLTGGLGPPTGCQPSPGASAAPEGPFRQVSGAEMLCAPNHLDLEQFFSHPCFFFLSLLELPSTRLDGGGTDGEGTWQLPGLSPCSLLAGCGSHWSPLQGCSLHHPGCLLDSAPPATMVG